MAFANCIAPILLLAAAVACASTACTRTDKDADQTPPAAAPSTSSPAAAPSAAAPSTHVSPTPPTAADRDPAEDREYPAARAACLAEVARQTNIDQSRLSVMEVLWAQAGVGVTIKVPGAKAPWSCLSDEAGNVQGAMYTGSEGDL